MVSAIILQTWHIFQQTRPIIPQKSSIHMIRMCLHFAYTQMNVSPVQNYLHLLVCICMHVCLYTRCICIYKEKRTMSMYVCTRTHARGCLQVPPACRRSLQSLHKHMPHTLSFTHTQVQIYPVGQLQCVRYLHTRKSHPLTPTLSLSLSHTHTHTYTKVGKTRAQPSLTRSLCLSGKISEKLANSVSVVNSVTSRQLGLSTLPPPFSRNCQKSAHYQMST